MGVDKSCIHPSLQPPAVNAENKYGFWSPLNNSSSFAVLCCHTLKSSDSLTPPWHLSCRLSLKVIAPSATSGPGSSVLKSKEHICFRGQVTWVTHLQYIKYLISTSLNVSKVSKCHYASRGHQAVGSCVSLYCGKVGINLLLHTDVAHVYLSKRCDVVMSSPCGGQTSSYAGQLAHTFISQPVTSLKQFRPRSHIRSDLFKGKWLR